MRKGIDYIGVGVGAMIFNDEGRVFLNKRGEKSRNEVGKWEFPGGGIDFGETCQDAIIREIQEEFDMDIQIEELLQVVDHIILEERQHWLSPCFLARYIGGIPKIMEPEKCSQIQWIDFEAIDFDSLSLASQSNYRAYKEKLGIK